jgi:hypothetical protein
MPLLSQEGWREAPGWFLSESCKDAVLEPPPARSRLRLDRVALLTQEGILFLTTGLAGIPLPISSVINPPALRTT